ncbi:prepilin peptidase [Paludicola sp. MB14-C6]|uniref:prepilin peptidase n=1 Tax=Paludihabitans sp. MB14-C6 TaxID=3070656 RepID=UPI0027DB660E|nr:A24 family peptidase [Paludicola sp. MB14-C6]WMJ22102.1 prepilin peptidase [Paludicola sp. MB14-C6]
MFGKLYFRTLIIILGLLIGSFLNVCIYRIPRKESIIKGSSHCTNCNGKIKAYDLIPIFSYIFLGGKCRNCKTKISLIYPTIELINFLLYIIILIQYDVSFKTVLYCALFSTLIVISGIDIHSQEIPNGLIVFLLCLSPLSFLINDMPFWHKLIGFFSSSAILFIIACFTDGFGGGDIKLMAVCGLLIGYQNILLALFIGCIIGGISGAFVLIKTKQKGSTIPFGPSLSIGIMISSLYGEQLINWYFSFL